MRSTLVKTTHIGACCRKTILHKRMSWRRWFSFVSSVLHTDLNSSIVSPVSETLNDMFRVFVSFQNIPLWWHSFTKPHWLTDTTFPLDSEETSIVVLQRIFGSFCLHYILLPVWFNKLLVTELLPAPLSPSNGFGHECTERGSWSNKPRTCGHVTPSSGLSSLTRERKWFPYSDQNIFTDTWQPTYISEISQKEIVADFLQLSNSVQLYKQ